MGCEDLVIFIPRKGDLEDGELFSDSNWADCRTTRRSTSCGVVEIGGTAARGIALRHGLGKVQHLEVKMLWLQQAVMAGRMRRKSARLGAVSLHLYRRRSYFQDHLGQKPVGVV